MLIQLRKLPCHLFFLLSLLFFLSCKKNINESSPVNNNNNSNNNNNNHNPTGQTPDLTTTVYSSVSGFVTDQNNISVNGASVSAGGINITTDQFGYFEIQNIQVIKTAAIITVVKTGYIKAIKTYIATNGKAAFFRIQLVPKPVSGSFSATTGGNISLSNGLVMAMPANAVVTASNSLPYSGTVYVSSYLMDPASHDFLKIQPGDLRGIDTSGFIKSLRSYGIAAVELTGGSGELLQIAYGKKATLTIPLTPAISSTAPASIPLWYFDESSGLWKEDGIATKTGNSYVGDVSHFSFWSFDDPADYVQFSCTVVDNTGQAIPNIDVVVFSAYNNYGNNGSNSGYTDSSGYISFPIASNQSVILRIENTCGSLYTQSFATTNVNVALGNIVVTATSVGIATISGTVIDCSNNPVTNGDVFLVSDGDLYHIPLGNAGIFNASALTCNGTANVTLIAVDNTTMQQNTGLALTLITGANAIGNLQACSLSTEQHLNYTVYGGTVNGGSGSDTFSSSLPTDIFYFDQIPGNAVQISVNKYDVVHVFSFDMNLDNIVAGSDQVVGDCWSPYNLQLDDPAVPVTAHITEYGPIGGFISGSFNGNFPTAGSGDIVFISCTFRVKRLF